MPLNRFLATINAWGYSLCTPMFFSVTQKATAKNLCLVPAGFIPLRAWHPHRDLPGYAECPGFGQSFIHRIIELFELEDTLKGHPTPLR